MVDLSNNHHKEISELKNKLNQLIFDNNQEIELLKT